MRVTRAGVDGVILASRLDIVDTALSLVTDLTSHIIELETRLASHTPLFDDETHIHRQLADLTDLANIAQSLEKSIKELLAQSKQLGNEKLSRTSDQLISRWKQINAEISQRFVPTTTATTAGTSRCLGNDRSASVWKRIDRFKRSMTRRSACSTISNNASTHCNPFPPMPTNSDRRERPFQYDRFPLPSGTRQALLAL